MRSTAESASDGGIPFLKDIPILGILFRRSESTSNKTNLYFFVTPTILDEDGFQDLYYKSLNKKLASNNVWKVLVAKQAEGKEFASNPGMLQTLIKSVLGQLETSIKSAQDAFAEASHCSTVIGRKRTTGFDN